MIPFGVSTVTTPLLSKFAIATNMIDKSGLHKTHTRARPLLGGMAIYISFAAMAVIPLSFDLYPRVLLLIGILTAGAVIITFKKLLKISKCNGVGCACPEMVNINGS